MLDFAVGVASGKQRYIAYLIIVYGSEIILVFKQKFYFAAFYMTETAV